MEISRLTEGNIKKMGKGGNLLWFPFDRVDSDGRTIPLIPLSKYFMDKLIKEREKQGIKKRASVKKINMNLHQLFKLLQLNSPTFTFGLYLGMTSRQIIPKHQLMTMKSSRDFFISTCVNSNVDTIGNIMGWSNPSSTDKISRFLLAGHPKPSQSLKSAFSAIKVPRKKR
jgi:hypothetical protein